MKAGDFFALISAFFFTSCTPFLANPHQDDLAVIDLDKLAKIEASSGGRLGVSAINTANNKHLQYRAKERFPFCSTFKALVAAAILSKSMTDRDLLQKQIVFSKDEVLKAKYSPITAKHLEKGLSVAQLCAATIQYSDNVAANLLIKELGGPEAITNFAATLGDEAFRLDRWEPELNSALPGDERDTTTPSSMEKSLHRLVIGDALAPAQREQLLAWLKGNTTGDTRIRAGVPEGWVVGDKTGTGDYGTTNDVGIIWPKDGGAPIVVAIYFTQKQKDAAARNDVIADATQILIEALR